MTVFADTSAVVKLYADEVGSEMVRSLEAVTVSQLCRVEVPAALWRKNRRNGLPVSDTLILVRLFENDLFGADAVLAPIRITSGILDDAARLTEIHSLRAYDAVQLATAKVAREVDSDCRSMAAFDVQLRTASAREGFLLIPAELNHPSVGSIP